MYKILSFKRDPLSVCSHLYMRIYMCGCVFEIRNCGEFVVLKYFVAGFFFAISIYYGTCLFKRKIREVCLRNTDSIQVQIKWCGRTSPFVSEQAGFKQKGPPTSARCGQRLVISPFSGNMW